LQASDFSFTVLVEVQQFPSQPPVGVEENLDVLADGLLFLFPDWMGAGCVYRLPASFFETSK